MDSEKTLNGAGESSPAPDCSALVEALRDTNRHIEELERIQSGSRNCLIAYEAKTRAMMLTERIIAMSQNASNDKRKPVSEMLTERIIGLSQNASNDGRKPVSERTA
jgi:hypothetical protein